MEDIPLHADQIVEMTRSKEDPVPMEQDDFDFLPNTNTVLSDVALSEQLDSMVIDSPGPATAMTGLGNGSIALSEGDNAAEEVAPMGNGETDRYSHQTEENNHKVVKPSSKGRIRSRGQTRRRGGVKTAPSKPKAKPKPSKPKPEAPKSIDVVQIAPPHDEGSEHEEIGRKRRIK